MAVPLVVAVSVDRSDFDNVVVALLDVDDVTLADSVNVALPPGDSVANVALVGSDDVTENEGMEGVATAEALRAVMDDEVVIVASWDALKALCDNVVRRNPDPVVECE